MSHFSEFLVRKSSDHPESLGNIFVLEIFLCTHRHTHTQREWQLKQISRVYLPSLWPIFLSISIRCCIRVFFRETKTTGLWRCRGGGFLWKLAHRAIDARKALTWCHLQAGKPRKALVKFSSSLEAENPGPLMCEGRRCTSPLKRGGYLPFLFGLALQQFRNAHLGEGNSSLFSLRIQMLIFSGNSLILMPRKNLFIKLSGFP